MTDSVSAVMRVPRHLWDFEELLRRVGGRDREVAWPLGHAHL